MKNKCTVNGSENTVIQGNCENEERYSDKPTWTDPAVTILCVFNFLLGAAVYKWVLWRWLG